MNEKTPYISAPGKGLMNESAHQMRLDFFKTLVKQSELITNTDLSLEEVRNNIESYLGTVELPTGLVGPLLFNEGDLQEPVYTALGTTEGSLVASMNRGAKAISESGGFNAHFVHQKMLRAPIFVFNNMNDAVIFEQWQGSQFNEIKELAGQHSNHAELIEIKPYIIGKVVHLKFIYTTCDASGQNTVTFCTWNAIQWMAKQFEAQKGIEICSYYIDGNGSSDKKVSNYSMNHGRGVHVVCECHLLDEVVEKTLRANSKVMAELHNHSIAMSRMDGAIGGTINIANAIAGIFASTGQDLGSIHESSLGVLHVEKTERGLYLSLSIPALVIGTIGGGTSLPTAKTMLELMNCYGADKIERFAKLIAGFALSLEISTFAAIASGQFARAHQKLGKNKTVNWLLKSEIDTAYITQHIPKISNEEITKIEKLTSTKLEDGILSNLVSQVSKKVIGLTPIKVHTKQNTYDALLKSKPLDEEVFKGLHLMASNVSSDLADTLLAHKDHLEYANTHKKEIEVYRFLKSIGFQNMPAYYGEIVDEEREVYMFLFELLNHEQMIFINNENDTKFWNDELILSSFNAIHKVHKGYLLNTDKQTTPNVREFNPNPILPFYVASNTINRKDYKDWDLDHYFDKMDQHLQRLANDPLHKKGLRTLVHNDFNTRNIAIRKNNEICIYDWELAMLDLPQRDIFEFLAFALPPDFESNRFFRLLQQHFQLLIEINGDAYDWHDYIHDLEICAWEFVISRVSLYLSGSTLVDYSFIKRVFYTANRMIDLIEKENR
jgi:hydroxymethylglutaryl-CoA reductase (NADPH)